MSNLHHQQITHTTTRKYDPFEAFSERKSEEETNMSICPYATDTLDN